MQNQTPTVLLIGTGHWSNPGLDFIQDEFHDMLAPARQLEIVAVLDQLSRFRPTHIGLEITDSMKSDWNDEFRAYREGTFQLTADERHQLGFRLAALSNHERIHAIDWHHPNRHIGWDDAITFALAHGQEHLIPSLIAHERQTGADRPHQQSVRDQLISANDHESLHASHKVYMDMAQIGSGDNHIGADVILRWYERNMMMFTNIARLAATPNARVAIIVGAGHIPLLNHFLKGADYSLTSIHTLLS